jgi:hypothetical protein
MENNRQNFIRGSPEFVLLINNTRMIIYRKNWAGHVACMGGRRENFLGKPDELRTLKTPRPRWEDNIKVDFKWIRRELVIAFFWTRAGASSGFL